MISVDQKDQSAYLKIESGFSLSENPPEMTIIDIQTDMYVCSKESSPTNTYWVTPVESRARKHCYYLLHIKLAALVCYCGVV